ncbi:MAG: cytochrome c5 family protein [Chlorobiaceae bacterium]|nr:cytochrome c5 family protein [Chlorobiaceae bacterium]
MKYNARLALFSLLFLGACGQEKTVQQTPAVHQETAERENNDSLAHGANDQLTDAKVAAGEEIYEASCAGCHDSGTAGAPKPGKKEDWVGRLELGIELLTKKSVEGYDGKTGAMPPKGGNEALSVEEVSNAVKYMVFKSR